MPLVHPQIGLAALLDDPGALGQVGDDLLGIAGIVHQQPEQLAVGRPVADMHGELGFGRGEAPGLNDLRHQIGAHLHDQLVEPALRPWTRQVVDARHTERSQQRQELSGFSSDQAGMPPAVMTMSSLSPLSRLST